MATASIGGYTVLREIARGAYSRVFVVQDAAARAQLALKLLENADDRLRHTGLKREYRLLRKYEHTGIPKVLNMAISSDGHPFTIMQLLPGQNLRALLRHRRDWVLKAYPVILRNIASALGWLHARGIVHCDLKPENIVVGAGGQAWLVDFASARSRLDWLRFWEPVPKEVSPSYIAPEQILGAKPLPQTDLYSLSATTFEVLAGHPPFAETSVRALYEAHLKKPPPLDKLAGRVSPSIVKTLAQGLEKEASRRPAETGVWAARLAGLIEQAAQGASHGTRAG